MANYKGSKSGTKAQQTLIMKMGEEGYRKWRSEMGKKGGMKSRNGGFASEKVGADGLTGRQRAMIVGKKGGSTKRVK